MTRAATRRTTWLDAWAATRFDLADADEPPSLRCGPMTFGDPFDFWFLGDLFGLALNFGELSLGWPAWGFVGANLLDTGLQALSNSGGDNGNYGYDNPGYGYQQQAYTPLCGNYYSDENPGCVQ